MKAFREWEQKHISPNASIAVAVVAYDAWKAALEWVLENGTLLDTHYACEQSTRQIINEELQE